MSENSEKSHEPTPHKLRDARNKGDIYKSNDLSSVATLLAALLSFSVFSVLITEHLLGLFSLSLKFEGLDFSNLLRRMIGNSFEILLVVTALLVIPAAILGVLTEFFQVGFLFASEKVNPDINKINPAEGLKRLFSMNNLITSIKSFFKAALVLIICTIFIQKSLSDLLNLFYAKPQITLSLLWEYALKIFLWISIIFLIIGMLDYFYQRHSYMQRQRMSDSEIKQEFKQSEGDPEIKNQRRQLHKEWSSRSVTQATKMANALVTNPTHIAIAIHYDSEVSPLPMVIAKGEGAIAALMRKTAVEHSIPVIENVKLARGLNDDAELDAAIPEEYFEAVAEVLLWAQGIVNGTAKTST
jgi:type III secretion protein U